MTRHCLLAMAAALALCTTACQPSEDDKAAPLMQKIETLYKQGDYQQTLNAITQLRANHPKAIKSRQRALVIWQDASLKLTQDEIGRTDSALQATSRQLATERNLLRHNQLRVKRDSLQVRYDALCGTVRIIHARQKQLKEGRQAKE